MPPKGYISSYEGVKIGWIGLTCYREIVKKDGTVMWLPIFTLE